MPVRAFSPLPVPYRFSSRAPRVAIFSPLSSRPQRLYLRVAAGRFCPMPGVLHWAMRLCFLCPRNGTALGLLTAGWHPCDFLPLVRRLVRCLSGVASLFSISACLPWLSLRFVGWSCLSCFVGRSYVAGSFVSVRCSPSHINQFLLVLGLPFRPCLAFGLHSCPMLMIQLGRSPLVGRVSPGCWPVCRLLPPVAFIVRSVCGLYCSWSQAFPAWGAPPCSHSPNTSYFACSLCLIRSICYRFQAFFVFWGYARPSFGQPFFMCGSTVFPVCWFLPVFSALCRARARSSLSRLLPPLLAPPFLLRLAERSPAFSLSRPPCSSPPGVRS